MKQSIFLRLVVIAVIGCSLVVAGGCKKKQVRIERSTNVTVQPAVLKQFRPFVETTGTLNPFEEISIGAEIDGIVKSIKVGDGAAVARGTLLATLDDLEYNQSVLSAQASLKQSEATYANTKLEFSRKDALFKEELVTKQQYDDVVTRLTLTESDIERAKAALSIAKQRLTKAKIYSPIASKVKEKLVAEGDFVKNGARLFTLIQSHPLKLRFSVSEKDIGKMRVGEDVSVKVDAFPDRQFNGKVTVVFPALDEKTRTLAVEAQVPDKEGMLKPGLFSRVILYTGDLKDTVVVPNTALLYEGSKISLYVVEDGKARERIVKIGNKYGDEIEITDGVKQGESVVTAGQQGLSEGAKVTVQGARGTSRPEAPPDRPNDKRKPGK